MNDQGRLSNLPTILVVILALFGLATIPHGQGKRPEGTEASAKASVEGAGHKSEAKGPNYLGPLNTLKEYWGNCGPCAKPPGDQSPKREVFEEELLEKTHNLQFLIVLVPDPDDKSMSHEFDSTLSAVLRATERAGYVAVRHWFPWDPPTRDQSKDEKKSRAVHCFKMPSLAKSPPTCDAFRRSASAMLVTPMVRSKPIVAFRKAAITSGPERLRIRLASSPIVTSRT